MKKTILIGFISSTLLFSGSALSASPSSCLLKLTSDVARDFDAKINNKSIHQFEKEYGKRHSKTDIYMTAAGLTVGLAISGVGAPLIPVVIPISVAAMGIQNGYWSVKDFFKNTGKKVSSGVKNHFHKKRRNKKLVENAKLLSLMIDVNRGYGTNLEDFSKDVNMSERSALRKLKMANATGSFCQGSNKSLKQIKKQYFRK